jgi:hypothetical protein
MSSGVDPKRLADNYRPQFGLDWVPVLPRDQLERMSAPELIQYHNARKQAEAWAKKNRTGSGWVLPAWRTIMANWQKYKIHVILGGNRSGKTELASRLCVWALGTIPEAELRCFDVNEAYSKQRQQAYIHDALPESLKNLPTKSGQNHATRYKQGQGFTNNQLILPPLQGCEKGGTINFVNYSQYENDPKTAEGWRAHLVWADEECPSGLFTTLPYRLVDFHGRLILTFTTLEGWTPLVQQILGKVRTLEWRYSDLVKRKLPVMQESLDRDSMAIYYVWTQDNPFIDAETFLGTLKGRSEDEILARAHGIPTKAAKAVFGKFSRDVNVIPHDQLPWIKKPGTEVTHYQVVDPGGNKNFFMLYVAVDATDTWYIWQEWPDVSYGPWSEPGPTPAGKPGPAQTDLGLGIKGYAELFRKLEEGFSPFERLIDPRLGAAVRQTEDGATTLISDFDKHDITFIPAPGVDIDNGLNLIKDRLTWNSEKPRDSLNTPKLFISERCEQTIAALLEYTARGGPEEASKDPIDCLRYLATSNVGFYTKADLQASGTE